MLEPPLQNLGPLQVGICVVPLAGLVTTLWKFRSGVPFLVHILTIPHVNVALQHSRVVQSEARRNRCLSAIFVCVVVPVFLALAKSIWSHANAEAGKVKHFCVATDPCQTGVQNTHSMVAVNTHSLPLWLVPVILVTPVVG